jgi:prepilin-type N-terminal cleavage/methylation domain-containing protein
MEPRGYSLLELLVVLVLLTLVAGGVMVSIKEPLRRARGQLALDEWQALDGQLRELARRTQRPVRLVVHVRRRILERVSDDDQGRSVTQSLPLAGSWSRVAKSGTESKDDDLHIPFWPDGRSATYAVEIPDAHGRPIWLVFAGVTGQPRVQSHAHTVTQLLDRPRAGGTDAR